MKSHFVTTDHHPFGAEFALRRLDPAGDLALLHTWMNDPEVARFWNKAWPAGELASYLERQHLSAHSAAYIGAIDGVPMSYWELYRADQDLLAQYYAARGHDTGVHLLLGPPHYRGKGFAAPLLDVVSKWLLDQDPRTTRIVAEPDVANRRSLRAFELAGFRRSGEVDLPNKRAALMIRDRHSVSPSERRPSSAP